MKATGGQITDPITIPVKTNIPAVIFSGLISLFIFILIYDKLLLMDILFH